MISPRLLAAARWIVLSALLVSCSDEPEQSNSNTQVQPGAGNPFAAPTPEARARKLLAFAFDAASKFPLESRTHAKNRGRAQYNVSHAALELELVDLAQSQVEPNEAWQKGLVLAEVALHIAERDGAEQLGAEFDAMVERASGYADGILEDMNQQAWRRDRIRVTLAQAQAALGRDGEIGGLLAGVETQEVERGRAGLARHLGDDVLGEQLARYEELKKTGSFAGLGGAAESFIVFHARRYENAVLRERIEAAIADLTQKLPLEKQFGFTLALAENAVAGGDAARAPFFVEKADGLLKPLLKDLSLSPSLEARLAELEHSAGQTEAARARLRNAIERFDAAEKAGDLIDIYMADALIPVAATYWKIGDEERSRELYLRASSAAILNPNSRPRCNDLVDLCISLAKTGVQPSDELAERMVRISDNLSDPW